MSQRWSNLLVWAGTIVFVVFVSKCGVGGQPGQRTSLTQPARRRASARGHLRDGRERARRRVHDDRHLQLRAGRDRHVPRVRRLAAHGRPRRLAAAVVVLPLVVLVVAPLFGIGLDRTIMRHLQGKPLVVQLMVTVGLHVRVHRSREHDLEPERRALDARAVPGPRLPHRRRCCSRGTASSRSWSRSPLAIGLRILLFRTRIGIAMRAVVDNRDLAALGGRALVGAVELRVGARLLARRARRHPARARDGRHVDHDAHVPDHHRVRGRGRRAAAQPAADVPRRADPRARDAWTGVVPQVLGSLDERARRVARRSCCSSSCCCCRAREIQFARIGQIRRIERVSTVRDTAIGMAVVRRGHGAREPFLLSSSDPTNINRLALGMCTALLALSLVPLTGWAGQVSLAPLAFAGIGAVAYARLGGAHGSIWAVFLAALVTHPGRRALRVPGDAAARPLSRARDARVRGDGRRGVLHAAVRGRSRRALGRARAHPRHRLLRSREVVPDAW